MHCNLRPPSIARVLLCFNYEANNAPAYQMSAQSGNARLKVINDLAHFPHPFYRKPHADIRLLRGTWTELHIIWRRHRTIIDAYNYKVQTDFRYLAMFRNKGDSKAQERSKMRPNFAPLSLVKVTEGIGETPE